VAIGAILIAVLSLLVLLACASAPTDAGAIAAAIAFFGIAAVAAVLVPARRALGIDAIQALRQD
jgi:hypothetical protein